MKIHEFRHENSECRWQIFSRLNPDMWVGLARFSILVLFDIKYAVDEAAVVIPVS